MEEMINQTLKRVKAFQTLFYLIAVALVVVGETSETWTGLYADDVRLIYFVEVIVILLTCLCIPSALKLFSWVMRHRIDEASIERALHLYIIWSGVRIGLLAIPVVCGLVGYYTLLSTQCLLCACIGVTASFFCLPGMKRLKAELKIDGQE